MHTQSLHSTGKVSASSLVTSFVLLTRLLENIRERNAWLGSNVLDSEDMS